MLSVKPKDELDFFKEHSGLSIEFEQKSVDARRLDSVKVGLPEESLEKDFDLLANSPQMTIKY